MAVRHAFRSVLPGLWTSHRSIQSKRVACLAAGPAVFHLHRQFLRRRRALRRPPVILESVDVLVDAIQISARRLLGAVAERDSH